MTTHPALPPIASAPSETVSWPRFEVVELNLPATRGTAKGAARPRTRYCVIDHLSKRTYWCPDIHSRPLAVLLADDLESLAADAGETVRVQRPVNAIPPPTPAKERQERQSRASARRRGNDYRPSIRGMDTGLDE